MRDKSCVVQMLCVFSILFIFAAISYSQEFYAVTGFGTIIAPSNSLGEGFGGGITVDFRMSKIVYVRPAYDFITADTNPGKFLSPLYQRHYVSLSVMLQRKSGYAYFPFIDAGVGYFFHSLRTKIQEEYNRVVVKKSDMEELKNGFGFHLTPGIRVQISPRLLLNFIAKMLFYSSEKSQFIINPSDKSRLNEAIIKKLNMSHFQVSWGVTFLF